MLNIDLRVDDPCNRVYHMTLKAIWCNKSCTADLLLCCLPVREELTSDMSSTSALSREECRKIVKRHLQRDDFELAWFAVAPLSTDMKGFMGDHLKLRTSVSLGDKESRGAKTIEPQFFVKSVPLDDAYRRSFAMASVAYQKEVLYYGDLLRDVQKHLRCSEYEAATYLGTVPQCYYLRPDLLVLEDLALAGFRVLDPMKPLDVHQCECVLKALARLHATSIVFEEREGRRLADKYPLLGHETLYRWEPDSQLYLAQVASRRATHILLDLVPRFAPGTPHNEKLHSLLDTVMESIYELLKPSDNFKNLLSDIAEGRHWLSWTKEVSSSKCIDMLLLEARTVNNMLFAEDTKGELSVRFVDFQTLHLEPPAHDVVPFLHLVTERDMRRVHGQRLLELYHQTLADVLRQHDLDIDSLLPLQIFLQSCEDTKPLAVLLAAYVLQFTMLPQPKDFDLESLVLDRNDLVKATYQHEERYRSRMTEAVEELVETCLMPRLREQQR
ncbi:uncharacterized protein LOC126456392 [Schistocerca serialis cubense]|uniref:uncharacterized protein LOC126456392 n=1 Tax=Schistocerca serialis cubense TaxID=2023355 RepID=UPI00214E6075|nr:uncharacterized protein LOC126456392 [Schistocerca serialis cubense]